MREIKSISLNEILHIPIGKLSGYEVWHLQDLLEQSTEKLELAKRQREWLLSAISLKYHERVNAKRLRLEKDSGVIHLEDDGFKVSCDIAKKVEWDQTKLGEIAANIMTSGGNLADYIDIHYNVPESRYRSWAGGVQNIFAPARTVKLGTPVYKLTKLGLEVDL